jgi:hypothetical protein
MRHLQNALAPAALVLLILGPLFFRLAEGGELRSVGGHRVDVYGVALYALFLVALVGGVAAAYRRL